MTSPPTRDRLARITLEFAITRLLLVAAGVLAFVFIPSIVGPEYHHVSTNILIDMWSRWDSAFYVDIALNGYGTQAGAAEASSAFFPVLPALIRSLLQIIPGAGHAEGVVAGLVISNAGLLAATIVLDALVRMDFEAVVARNVRWLIWLSPSSIFFSGVYTEALFLLFSVLAVYSARRQRWLIAGLAGFIAGLTRPVGLAVAIPLLFIARQQSVANAGTAGYWTETLRRLSAAAAPVLGAMFYIGGTGLAAGDPFAYFTMNQSIWNRDVRLPWQALTDYLSGPPTLFGWDHSLVNLAFLLGFAALALGVFRFSKGEGWYSLTLLAVPLFSGNLISMPRYSAVAYPVYIALARWLGADRKRVLVVMSASFLLSIVFTARFVTWRWVA